MEVIKLDRRYKLWHRGYPVALKFDSFQQNVDKIFLIHSVGFDETLGHYSKRHKSDKSDAGYDREYLLGFKSESDITGILLKI